MENWKSFLKLPILLVAMSSVHAISAQSPPPPTSSAPSSPTSATRVSNGEVRIENGELKKNSSISPSSVIKLESTNESNIDNGQLRNHSSNFQFSTLNSQLASACAAVADELAASRTLI